MTRDTKQTQQAKDRAEAVFAILEHEAMHQETLRYMCHRLPLHQKRRPAGYSVLSFLA